MGISYSFQHLISRVLFQQEVEFEILSCEVNGDTATAKVRDKYLGISFLDSLSLVKEGDKWSIYSKLFHVEA